MNGDTQDMVVVGGGIAGLSFAAAVRTLAPHLSVAVIDAARNNHNGDERWSAITAAGRRLFEAVGAWEALAGEAEPIREMILGMASPSAPVKPADLTIAGEVAPGEPFAHMVANGALVPALRARAETLGITMIRARVADLEIGGGAARLGLHESAPVSARLVVAADGGRSLIRTLAGFRTISWDYDQIAFVTTVAIEKPHGGTAVQVFLSEGPIAALPIPDNRFSVVWTTSKSQAEQAMDLSDADLCAMLNERLGWRFGAFTLAGPREAYPLRLELARDLVADRVALLGDAAHAIHPLAGQGLNLAFKDAAVLAEVLMEAAELGLDPGSEAVLLRYQQQRRFDAVAMGAVTDSLNRVFSLRVGPLRPFLGFGMQLMDRFGPLKDRIMREAAGVQGRLPLLLRGAGNS